MMLPNPWKWCTWQEGIGEDVRRLALLRIYREIVNDEGEYCCACFVSPEAWSVLDRIIAELVKVLSEFHIGNDPGLF